MFIKYNDADCSLIETHATKVVTKDGEFYYFPYWMKKVGENKFEEIRFSDLPESVAEAIMEERALFMTQNPLSTK